MAKSDDNSTVWDQLTGMSAADVIGNLKQHRHDVWQEIWNSGHSTAHGKGREAQESIQAELEESRSELEKLQKQLEKVQSEQPDVAKIHEEYKQEIDELKTKHREAMKQKDQTIREREIERGKSNLRAALVKAGVDPDYAEIMVERENVRGRLSVDEEFKLNVMQEGKEIPVQPAENRTAVEHLAEELKGAVPAKFVVSEGDRGSGARRPGTPGGGNHFQQLRERVAEERQTSSSVDPQKRLHEKLGIRD